METNLLQRNKPQNSRAAILLALLLLSILVHLWRYRGGYPALTEVMNKLKQNKVTGVQISLAQTQLNTLHRQIYRPIFHHFHFWKLVFLIIDTSVRFFKIFLKKKKKLLCVQIFFVMLSVAVIVVLTKKYR